MNSRKMGVVKLQNRGVRNERDLQINQRNGEGKEDRKKGDRKKGRIFYIWEKTMKQMRE